MGIGTKIKDALNPERHNQYDSGTTTADTTKTPGSFPSDEIPRSHKYDGVHSSTHDSSLESKKGEKLAGNHSPEYTYGHQNSATTTDPDKLELGGTRRDENIPGSTGAVGTAGASGVHGNKLSKGHREPYWGDAGRPNSSEFGNKTTGAYDRNGNNLDSNEVNNRYNNTSSSRDDFGGHRGDTTARSAAADEGLGKSGISGISQSGNATGRTGAGKDNLDQFGTNGRGVSDHDTIRTGGATSNLPHRPHDINNTARDYKTDEYDAPTNSSGRGRTAGAVGAGAAAEYGASELSNRHHEHDMREYDAAGSNRHAGAMTGGSNNNTYDNYNSPDRVSATSSMLDPHNQHSNQTTSTTGSSMLDPYNNNNNNNNNNKHTTTSTGHGILNHHDKHHTSTTAPITSDHINNRNTARDSGFSHGAERDTSSIGSSSYGQPGQTIQGTTMGEDHFGPGHAGARVHHQCHNCGADNDISKYFRKDAVYRMS